MPKGIYKHKLHAEETRKKMSEAKKGKRHSEEMRKKMSEVMKGRVPWIKGKRHSEESRRKMSVVRKGWSPSEETRRKMSVAQKNRPIMSKETRRKISESFKGRYRSEEHRRKLSEAQRGEKGHNWKGGIYPKNLVIRKSVDYKLWREAVFKRDNYTCIWCGDNRGGNLNADHIKPFAYYPELRFAIDNGRTLCVDCHKKTETYGSNRKHGV